jgi:Tfp pilus assembly protein PilN
MGQSINLIPKEERSEQQQVKVVRASSVITIIMLVSVVAVSGYYWYLTSSVKRQISAQEQKIETYRRDITNLSDIEISARTLDSKYKILQEIYSENRNYSVLLDELNKRVPAGVTVTSFGVSGEELNNINLSGKGSDYIAVGRLINALSDDNFEFAAEGLGPLFTDVTLNSVTLDTQGLEVSYFIVVSFDTSLIK